MDQNLLRILSQAQKSGVLQVANRDMQNALSEVYQLNTLRLSDRGFYENTDITKVLLKNCRISSISEQLGLLETL